ncbi:MAG: hypothetical protein IPL90_07090 [Holophagales bacterium]|nr:hypothetical protein [Holophagales bacterium]
MPTKSSPAFGPAIAGLALFSTTLAPAQESAPTPSPVPVATPAPARDVDAPPARPGALPCAPAGPRSFMSGPQMPLPPDLSGDVRIVKAGKIRIGRKPPKLAPFVVKEFRLGPRTGWSAVDVDAFDARFDATFGFHVERTSGSISFQLAREDLPDAPLVTARCAWGFAAMSMGLSRGSVGVEARVPQRSTTFCEFLDAPDGEPSVLFLEVGPPSNLFNPRFPSHGGLVRGKIRYEAISTNVMNPALLGMRAPMITGTVFWAGGRAVAAVERLLPGRVLIACSVPAAEESLFVAVGTALLVQDLESGAFPH